MNDPKREWRPTPGPWTTRRGFLTTWIEAHVGGQLIMIGACQNPADAALIVQTVNQRRGYKQP